MCDRIVPERTIAEMCVCEEIDVCASFHKEHRPEASVW